MSEAKGEYIIERLINKGIHMPLMEAQQIREYGSAKETLDPAPLPRLISPILHLDEKTLSEETHLPIQQVPSPHSEAKIVTQRIDQIWKNTHRLAR